MSCLAERVARYQLHRTTRSVAHMGPDLKDYQAYQEEKAGHQQHEEATAEKSAPHSLVVIPVHEYFLHQYFLCLEQGNGCSAGLFLLSLVLSYL